MSEASPKYLAYMLRIWQSRSGGRFTWRASLESPHTGERQSFQDLTALCAFLHVKAFDADGADPSGSDLGEPSRDHGSEESPQADHLERAAFESAD